MVAGIFFTGGFSGLHFLLKSEKVKTAYYQKKFSPYIWRVWIADSGRIERPIKRIKDFQQAGAPAQILMVTLKLLEEKAKTVYRMGVCLRNPPDLNSIET